eukprot:CAMPEP_0172534778 /NCGR_PEP_ID=MMETSP1067-20121228/7023_1 /TAXON_ID=265564 ORGANISM="Thalassiosira punctigera, Strain Tpunct2005C2" /NCGR_SAMPLE_ID=MMETSP1067 /ASSEMBLY_ACC=CAM_ASM_000444 /LENGTH=370 /DNA_ID=CAMNT_0013319613 /DNA_START=154 /DNA_END=1266 /DNA_ORIENTATION=+
MAPNANVPQPQSPSEPTAGELERLKQEEARLSSMLASIRQQKLSVLRSRTLTVGIIGFGRFGQFIGEKFTKYGNVIGTSRSDYTKLANEMGAKYVPLSDLESFVMEDELDVIVVAVSIVSFEDTVKDLVPHLKKRIATKGAGSCPLIVDVLSVKEHARKIFLERLPEECDILCTHPMFGPDSAKHGWHGQTFVYERTRIDKVLLDPSAHNSAWKNHSEDSDESESEFLDEKGVSHGIHENSEAHVEGMDRIERFLSIWEEEGCNMISMSCKDHDAFTANSQFITHLMGRILGVQGLKATPIDTKGFQNVLKLIETTNADSFDLFYGLYKFNRNSMEIIHNLRSAMDDVVRKLLEKEGNNISSVDMKKSCL